ncbi:MAG TPA: hypothetical protein VF212_12240 [Longimicrobiales bacterium]
MDTTAEHYGVDWRTNRFDLVEGATYRIRVLLEDRTIGYVDVQAVDRGEKLRNVKADEIIPLANGRTLPIRSRIETHLELSPPVPAQAPDTAPHGFYDESNIRSGSACATARMLRGIVAVWFQEGTTQSEKQAAVDLIGGEVVGGFGAGDHDSEGIYYVRVEDDEEGKVLCEAIETLNALPQFSVAMPELLVYEFHREPDDGGDWAEAAWQVDPDVVRQSPRWGLEAIGAPLAWGCTTGNPASMEEPVGIQRVTGVGWHALRRRFATDLDGIPLEVPARLGGGRSSEAIFKYYQKAEDAVRRDTLERRRRKAPASEAERAR